MKTLKTLKLSTNCKVDEMEISNDLHSLQDQVGGYIEMPVMSKLLLDKGIDIVINEEGKLLGLTPTMVVVSPQGKILDTICGDVLFVSHDAEGNTVSLSEEQRNYLLTTVLSVDNSCGYHYFKGTLDTIHFALVKKLEVE